MRQTLGQLLRRATVGVLTLAMWAPCGSAVAAPLAPSPEADSLAFAQRYRAVQHGGIVRAANASATCLGAGSSCRSAQSGGAGANGDFEMGYIDVDRDPNTYNSSRAEVRLPAGARVTYARLYWGGNLLAGEQKPWEDNGRVLIAEPGGEYKELIADTLVGHRVADGADAFQASADVTRLVRDSAPGLYTVAQVNVAMGRSAAGTWGGWTLVVAYNGDRGTTGDSFVLTADGSRSTAFAGTANPYDDVLNSTIADPADAAPARVPAYANTLGYDSDVFDLAGGLERAGDRATFRLTSERDAAWAGVLFAAVDARR